MTMISSIQAIATNPVHCKTDSRYSQESIIQTAGKQDLEPEKKRLLLCRHCMYSITTPDERITVNGSHNHTFANPYGIIFEIGCFRKAEGCGLTGAPSDEFTWFRGFFWQIAVCQSCLTHLGWWFSSPEKAGFFGLISDRLIESASSDT